MLDIFRSNFCFLANFGWVVLVIHDQINKFGQNDENDAKNEHPKARAKAKATTVGQVVITALLQDYFLAVQAPVFIFNTVLRYSM